MSGARDHRPGLTQLLDYARAGDLVVVALDRLGRSLSGMVRTPETLTERGAFAARQVAAPVGEKLGEVPTSL